MSLISAILEFSPERLTEPGVIVGLVLMVVGLIAVLASGVIADMLPKKEERPFVLSEFGGYSMIVDGHVWDRKKSFGYIMYKSKEALSKAFKRLYEKQIIPLIPKGLSAIVYTQVSDVEFEVNGIMTYDRAELKLDEETVKKVNSKIRSIKL